MKLNLKRQIINTNATIVEAEKTPYNIVISNLLKLIGKVDTYTDSLSKTEPKGKTDYFKELLGLNEEKPDHSFETVDKTIQKNEPSLSPVVALAIATIGCTSLDMLLTIIDSAKRSNEAVEKDVYLQKLVSHSLKVYSQIDAIENSLDVKAYDIEEAFYQMAILIA